MKKRLTALTLALLLALSVTACGDQKDGDASASGASSSASSSVNGAADTDASSSGDSSTDSSAEGAENDPAGQQPDPAQSAGTENPSADAGQESGSQPAEKPVSKPAEKPASKPAEKPASKPTEKPAEKPATEPTAPPATNQTPEGSKPADGAGSASSGDSSAVSEQDLTAFYTDISGGENFPAMMEVTGEMLDATYAGLNDLAPKQSKIYMAMISAVAAEVALVEVSSADQVQTVKDIFQARIDYQIEQGAFYPASVEAWQNSAQIVTNGNCVMLLCLTEGAADIVTAFQAL